MVSYGLLTAIQALLIITCGISVLDVGVDGSDGGDKDGLSFNKLLFDEEEGLPNSADFLADNDFWYVITLWGYLFLAVGLIQIFKSTIRGSR
ncbi:MAG: hypothetical protein ACXACI_11980 [Candidatus Hodarchaeales archaeon]|jgi:hypothetical protein